MAGTTVRLMTLAVVQDPAKVSLNLKTEEQNAQQTVKANFASTKHHYGRSFNQHQNHAASAPRHSVQQPMNKGFRRG